MNNFCDCEECKEYLTASESGVLASFIDYVAYKKVKQQLEKANAVIKHIVYNSKDSTDLAYEYLEENGLLNQGDQ